MNVTIRRQKRGSLAFRLTPKGAVVLVPRHLDPEGDIVQAFIADSLARLPQPEPVTEPLTPAQVHELVADRSQKIGVQVVRTQIRAMRNKWGSISTAGTLTLATDILNLPHDLVEYIVVHELLHLKLPDHRQGWQVSMGMYLPDWREREKRLRGFVVQPNNRRLESSTVTAELTSRPSEPALPTVADVVRAHKVVGAYLARTPLHHYPALDALVGAEVYVKHENYQPIGAFKVRGGVNYMAHLTPEERARGVVTASTGNHGQSISYAAGLFGVPAVIVVPEGANPVKVEAMRSHGAQVVFHGDDFEASKVHAARLASERDMRFVSSGDEPLLIAGVGTHTLEIVQERPDVEMILVPIGGGSGAAGACLVVKALNPAIQVIGVQSSASPAAYLTWKARRRQSAENRTQAEGLATGEPFMLPQRILWRHLDNFVLVDDDDLMAAVRIYLEKAKTLAEPAGAAPLAAALRLREQVQGRKIVLILSGGNISPQQLRACLI